MKIDFTKLVFVIVGVILVILTFAVAVYADEYVGAGDCRNFSYVDVGNVSRNFTYCNNASVYNFSSLDVTLDPGEFKSGVGIWDYYSASCNSCDANYSGSICSVSKSLTAGSSYRMADGVCDVDVSCEDSVITEYSNLTEHSFNFDVSKNGSVVLINYDNESKSFPLSESEDFSYHFSVNRECPEIVINDSENDKTLLDFVVCAEMLSSSNDRAFNFMETTGNVLKDCTESSKSCVGELGDARASEEHCKGELDYFKDRTQNTTGELRHCNSQRTDYYNTAVFLLAICVVSIIVNMIQFYFNFWGGD